MKVSYLNDLNQRILRRVELPAEELQRRLESAQKELVQAKDCNYQVENEWGKVWECVSKVIQIILAEIKNLY